MSEIDVKALRPSALTTFTALRITGAEAKSYLQGQLSADMQTLTPDHVLLTSCNSAQGRVQAVLWFVERTDGLAMVLPASLVEPISARLKKFVLRSKVVIDPNARLSVGVVAAPAPADGEHIEREGVSLLRLPGCRQALVLGWPGELEQDPRAEAQFHREQIEAGLPTVYPETHEAFVAQMLNIDALGGISFTKGCYTGQEIIARAHYRGVVKRRMHRFASVCPPPAPGTRVLSGEQHAGDVVAAVATSDGCELLAVISNAQLEQPLTLDQSRAPLSRLPLPYVVAENVG